MKRSFILFLTIALSLLSCEREPDFEKIEYVKYNHQLFEENVKLGVLIKQVFKDLEASPKELLTELGYDEQQSKKILDKLNLYVALAKDYTMHGVAYNTKDPLGKSIVASGLIYYPQKRKPKGVIYISPFFKNKGTSGTDVRYSVEAVLVGMGDYVCIIPDGIGLGVSSNQPISIIQHENLAEAAADLYLAAKEFIYNHYHYKLPQKITLFGYSLGASGAWSFARYLTLHKELNVTVKDIFIGGGVYYPELYGKDIFETRYTEYAAAPYVLWSLDYYENLNLDFTKIFKGKLLDGFPELCDGHKGVRDVTAYIGTDLNNYFDEDFLNNEQNQYRQSVMTALEKNSIPNDWLPEGKVFLYNCFTDLFGSSICGDALYDYLKEINADVEYIHEDMTHEQMIVYMVMDFYNYLYSDKLFGLL
ncbi:MAG: hypothetical protein ACOX5T_05370 [Candidatus Cryptobacteroides sp.]|jgi:pimeloyl-ACP methyl ester carboxylesterase